MSLTRAQARGLVRRRTRHQDEDDPRASSDDINDDLDREYKGLRLELQEIAPQLYLKQSGDLVLPDDSETPTIELDATACGVVSNVFRVDRYFEGVGWREIDQASELSPYDTNGKRTFYRQGNCLVFGPDRSCGGTYRVIFHVVPVTLTDDTQLYLLPDCLDDALTLRAIGWQLLRDGDGPAAKAEHDKLAAAVVERFTPMLRKQYGRHTKRPGLRMR
jgi:hypothetical protein